MENELKLLNSQQERWFSTEELAELLGFGSGLPMQSNPNILDVLNGFSNSNNVKMGGYHNAEKLYSENVLKALKQEAPLNELSINFQVNTRLGGYHNTRKLQSGNMPKALKQYQLRNPAQ